MKSDANQVQALRCRVATHIAPYHSLLLAFSGGLDSTVLLDVLTALRDSNEIMAGIDVPALRAVHVHHGLNSEADSWIRHCTHECSLRDVVLSSVHVVLNATTPEGIEAAARRKRYDALAATLADNEVLLTAQHQDDQAETLLLALKRGSGPAGLAGMAVNSPFRSSRLVRPLLECSRIELEAYARTRGLRWIDDSSNTDPRFDRNFLRLQILPLLRQRWPQFASATARSAQLCAAQEQLLDELLTETLNKLTQSDGSLLLTDLTKMSDIKRAAILRRWLASCSVKMPSRQQLTHLWKDVALSRRDAVAQIQIDNWLVRRFRDRLYVLSHLPKISDSKAIFLWPPESERLTLPAGIGTLLRSSVDINSMTHNQLPTLLNSKGKALYGSLAIPDANACIVANNNVAKEHITIIRNNTNSRTVLGAVVRAPLPYEHVSVRFGSVHGLLYIMGRRRGRTLKKIWQELNIPPWQRCNTPLLFYNDQLIAALGIFVTWEGATRKSEEQWQLFRLLRTIK